MLAPIDGEQFTRYAVANSLCTVHEGQTLCRLMNFHNKRIVISPVQKLGQLQLLDQKQKCLLVSIDHQKHEPHTDSAKRQKTNADTKTLNAFAAEQNFNINPDLSPDLRLQLLNILYRRKEAFAKSVSDLKAYNKLTTGIRTKIETQR